MTVYMTVPHRPVSTIALNLHLRINHEPTGAFTPRWSCLLDPDPVSRTRDFCCVHSAETHPDCTSSEAVPEPFFSARIQTWYFSLEPKLLGRPLTATACCCVAQKHQ